MTRKTNLTKCIAAFAAILLFAATPSYGQVPDLELTPLPEVSKAVQKQENKRLAYTPRWIFGVKVSYRHTYASWTIDSSYDGNRCSMSGYPGFAIGFATSYPFSNLLSFDTGIDFTSWGFSYIDSNVTMTNLRYMLEVPLTVTLHTPIGMQFQAGAVVDVLLTGQMDVSKFRNNSGWPYQIYSRDPFNPLSVGLTCSIGFYNFSLQFIYNLTNAIDREAIYTWEQYSGMSILKQKSYAISLNYTLWF